MYPPSSPFTAARPFARWTILVLVGLLLSSAALAQDWRGRARVQGLVSDENGNPVEGATVTLRRGSSASGPDAVTTNKKGRWSFLGLSGGPWNVTIEYPGYTVSEGVMPVSEATPNELLRIMLEPAGAATGTNPAADAAAAQEAEAAATLSQAAQLLEQGKGAEARGLMEKAMSSIDPSKHPEVLLRIAQSHFSDGDVATAISTLEKGLTIDPQHVESLKLISSLLVNEGRKSEADVYIARLPQGAKIDPNALLNQGIQKYNANDMAGALEDFEAIVADYPDNADAYYYRGLVLMSQGTTAGAVTDFEKMLELAPDHPNAGEAKQFLDYLKTQ